MPKGKEEKQEEVKEEIKEEVKEEVKEEEERKSETEEVDERQEKEDAAVKEQDDKTKDEIAEMLDLKPEEKKEEKDEEVKEEVVEEEVKEKAEEEKVEEKGEVEEKEEEDPLLTELGRLTDLIAKAEKGVPTEKPEEKKEEKEEEEKKEEKPAATEEQSKLMEDLRTPVDTQQVEYFNKDMFKESLEEGEVKSMNEVMNKVVEKVRTDTRRQTLQDAMKIFPSMIDYKVQGYMAAQQFWQNNRDLKQLTDNHPKVKSYVEYRATEIQRMNPNWTLGQVYQETEKEVRDLLKDRLTKFRGEEEESTESGKRPALSRKPGAGRKAPVKKPVKPDSEQAEILEMIEFLEK
jgi:hypothetical protein